MLKHMCGVVAVFVASCNSVLAACDFAPQGEGRVKAIIDARTFRLTDGREVMLAGIETYEDPKLAARISKLALLIEGREVTLRAENDKPDRYGRQAAIVFPAGSDTSVQTTLLSQGDALASGSISDKACSLEWAAAETAARNGKLGLWGRPAVTKNAEMPGDILARIGQFTIVEGPVLSARQAGSTFYVNFGRRWTRDFAVTISRRMMPSFEAAGLGFKSLEGKTIRVRGWVERRGGPRIEATHPGQIEIVGMAGGMTKNIVPQDEGK